MPAKAKALDWVLTVFEPGAGLFRPTNAQIQPGGELKMTGRWSYQAQDQLRGDGGDLAQGRRKSRLSASTQCVLPSLPSCFSSSSAACADPLVNR